MTWSSIAPDLNPVKHLWSILKQKVQQQNPSRKEQKIAEYLSTDSCRTFIIHAQQD